MNSRPTAEATEQYIRILERVDEIIMKFPKELSGEGIYMMRRIRPGIEKEAKGEYR